MSDFTDKIELIVNNTRLKTNYPELDFVLYEEDSIMAPPSHGYMVEHRLQLLFSMVFFAEENNTEQILYNKETFIKRLKHALYEDLIPLVLDLRKSVYEQDMPKSFELLNKLIYKVY